MKRTKTSCLLHNRLLGKVSSVALYPER